MKTKTQKVTKTKSLSCLLALIAAAGIGIITPPVKAGTHVWSGAVDGNWSTPGNWSSGGAPSAAEAPPVIVQFPSTASARRGTTNNIANLKLDVLYLFGADYHLSSSAPITLTGSQPPFPYAYNLSSAGSGTNVLDYSADLVLSTNATINVGTNAELHIQSIVSGAGGFTKAGAGNLFLDGEGYPNTYNGPTTVLDGTLSLARYAEGYDWYYGYYWYTVISIPRSLTIGDTNMAHTPSVVMLAANQLALADVLTINPNGALHLVGADSTIPGMVINGGSVYFDQGLFLDMENGWMTGTPTINCSNIVSNPSGSGTTTIFGPGNLYYVKDWNHNVDLSINVTAGNLMMTAPIGADDKLIKSGPGNLVLGAEGDFWGDVIVGHGALTIDADLYSIGASSLIVSNGAQLNIGANVFCDLVPHLNGFGTNRGGAALLATGNGATLFKGISIDSDAAIYVATNVQLTINSSNSAAGITGPGSLMKKGAGTLQFVGDKTNGISGTISVDQGTLALNNVSDIPAINSPLVIGRNPANGTVAEVKLLNQHQLALTAPITINDSGTLNLNGFYDTAGPLTLMGGDIKTLGGLLILSSDLLATNGVGSIISGAVNLGGAKRTFHLAPGYGVNIQAQLIDAGADAGFDLDGGGTLTLSGPNSFLFGPIDVKAGLLYARNNAALGDPSGGTTIAAGARLAIDGRNLGAEPITLSGDGGGYGALSCSGTNILTGPITLTGDTTLNVVSAGNRLEMANAITGTGGITKIGEGTLAFSGNPANSYIGATTVSEGALELSKANLAIPGALSIGDNASAPGSHLVRILSAGQLAASAPVTINASGVLDLSSAFFAPQTVGSLTGSGPTKLGVSSLSIGGDNTDTQYNGQFTGTGTLIKQGAGKFTLGGTSDQFFGSTVVNAGTLNVANWIPASPVSVNAGAKLMGGGLVGNIASAGGIVSPGCCPATKKLSSKNLVLDSASTFPVELLGTNAGVFYSQLAVTGTVDLGNATLGATLGFNSAVSNKFIIIDNDSNDPVTGTFKNLPEGATLIIGGAQFQITYHGGDGNDVALTQTSAVIPPNMSGVQKLPDGKIQVTATGLPNTTYTLQATDTLTPPVQWTNIGTANSDGQGKLQFVDPDAPNHTARFYRLALP